MTAQRWWGRTLVLALALLAALAGAASAQGLRAGVSLGEPRSAGGSPYMWWHRTLVQNLDRSPARRAVLSDGSRAIAREAAGTPSGQTLTLSNERTFTTWANPARVASIYAQPNLQAGHVGRLHMSTEDGFPEVYLLLREQTDTNGRDWVQLRIPARPNGQIGWVLRSALGPFEQSYWLLVVNRRTERLTAYWRGHVRFRAPVGVGKRSTPTPPGHFWIRERFRVPDPSSAYWPYAMGTSDYSSLSEWPGGGVVGIHGAWGQPWLIPGHPSHGCIRMHNPDVAWLVPRVTVGTPLRVI